VNIRSTSALATLGLTRTYGSRVAVDALDLEVRRGEVFGFLGPNGAGKTTTIRMLLGLVRPTSGRVEILGQPVTGSGAHVLRRVGALIESPALYPHLSGRDNLRCFADALGGASARHLDGVLELVGLRERQGDRVQSYSLGMRQRLAIAVALLHDPELLVLDEPANGLDPAGIVEIRLLLRRLAGEARTVFVSSHVLAEVQETCDRIAIVSRGRLVRLAPVADLVGDSEQFEVRTDDPVTALDLVRRHDWGASARIEHGVLVTASPTGRGRDLIEFLETSGIRPDGVGRRQRSLEEVFLHLTEGGAR
jgi:ABC-2 type transport system ATP-binding protein